MLLRKSPGQLGRESRQSGKVSSSERDALSLNNRKQPWQDLEQSQAEGTVDGSKEGAEFIAGGFVFSTGENVD